MFCKFKVLKKMDTRFNMYLMQAAMFKKKGKIWKRK